jgi:hypothetical protein
MRSIFYLLYAGGAFFGLLFTTYMEWWLALPLLLAIPYAALYIAEDQGYVRFHDFDGRGGDSLIDRIVNEDLTDKEAAAKYGWAVVVEMDERLKTMQNILEQAQIKREKFVALIEGNK